MWPDTRLTELLGIDHPIIQAPMAGSSTPDMAAAVCAAGGLGSLGCKWGDADQVRGFSDAMRARTNLPFNLNFFVTPAEPAMSDADFAGFRTAAQPVFDALDAGPVPDKPGPFRAGFDDDMLALVLDLRPPVVSFHFGLPTPDAIAALKDAGITLLASATTVAEARQIEAAGLHAVIAQSYEAGGHRGSFAPGGPDAGIGLMSLLPQIVDAVTIPVIAAGGIADGRGIAAALALGAAGVQIGTAFLRSPEASTSDQHRAAIASTQAEGTVFTAAVSGRAARGMATDYARAMNALDTPFPPFGAMYEISEPVMDKHRIDAPDKASFYLFGQSAPLTRAEPTSAIMERLITETRATLTKLGATT